MWGRVAAAILFAAFCACDKSDSSARGNPPHVVAALSAAPASSGSVPPVSDVAADYRARVDTFLPIIRRMAAVAEVLDAVKKQNADRLTPEDIKKLDERWTAATGIADFMRPYMENACAKALRKVASETRGVVEAFVMDKRGALVCTVSKTSDYWQGDEAKWQKSFNEGKGAVFIDKPLFDDSSQTYSFQASLPVMEGSQAIGAITVGLDVARF